MRDLIDIGHPAHIHYFRNLMQILSKKGFSFMLSAQNRKYVPELVDFFTKDYVLRNSGASSIIGKVLNIPRTDFEVYKLAKSFKPDIFLGSKNIYFAHVSKLMKRPFIAITDTEVSDNEDRLAIPFIDSIITPHCFRKDYGKKHIRLNTYFELNYLHPNYFKPNSEIFNYLGININEKYAILRFV